MSLSASFLMLIAGSTLFLVLLWWGKNASHASLPQPQVNELQYADAQLSLER